MEQAINFEAQIVVNFSQSFQLPFTFWGNSRIPSELKTLLAIENPKNVLELGCGIGQFSNYVAKQGIQATGVDLSRIAIEKARLGNEHQSSKPNFMIGDVTNLHQLTKPFDLSFDMGCFHNLSDAQKQQYATELQRLLRPGATHLIWAKDLTLGSQILDARRIATTFEGFKLIKMKSSRRRLVASHWYWLVKEGASLNALSLQD